MTDAVTGYSSIDKIEPTTDFIQSHRLGRLHHALTVEAINTALGFPGLSLSYAEGDGKVTMQWDFYVHVGRERHECSIWDYKGARWSFYGPRWAFVEIFGANVLEGN
jgi:hypothetical protein